MCVLYVSFGSNVRPRILGCVARGRVVYVEVQIALIFRRVWSERGANCFDGIKCEIVMLCPEKNGMYIFLVYTRALVCRCDGDIICVGHNLNRCSGLW